jgi:hypothetical protein
MAEPSLVKLKKNRRKIPARGDVALADSWGVPMNVHTQAALSF